MLLLLVINIKIICTIYSTCQYPDTFFLQSSTPLISLLESKMMGVYPECNLKLEGRGRGGCSCVSRHLEFKGGLGFIKLLAYFQLLAKNVYNKSGRKFNCLHLWLLSFFF